MAGEFKENIYYKRKSNPGDTTIEGRASNGITLDNTGNVFLYSSHDQNIINELTSSNYTGSIDISPNNDKSFIGVLSTSTDSLISRSPINITMGSINYVTLQTQADPNNFILPPPPAPIVDGEPNKFISNPIAYDRIGSGYLPPNRRNHYGLDLMKNAGEPVRAVWDGEVLVQGLLDPNGYGNLVILSHTNASGSGKDYSTLYAHLKQILVTTGSVTAGQIIGISGGAPGAYGAGNSTAPHLHFETARGIFPSYADYINAKSTKTLDPTKFLLGENVTGVTLPGDEDGGVYEKDPDYINREEVPTNNETNGNEESLPSNTLPIPDDEEEGYTFENTGSYSRIPSPEETGASTPTPTIPSTPDESKVGKPGVSSCSREKCPKTYIKSDGTVLPFTQTVPSTTITLASMKKQVLSATNNDIVFATSLWAIYWAEAMRYTPDGKPYGVSADSYYFSNNSYNYTGIQTDAGSWGSKDKFITSQRCDYDANARNCRAFAIFSSQSDALAFMVDRAKAKGFDKTDTKEKWARVYLNTWNAYNMETNNPELFNKKFKPTQDVYNTAVKIYWPKY